MGSMEETALLDIDRFVLFLEYVPALYAHGEILITGSIQFSPMAGRILFKDLRYHSSNMSIRVLKGHVTWRYWLWLVREEGSSGEFVNE